MYRRLLLIFGLCSCTALVGCAEIKGASNSPQRTQRPSGFFGAGTATTAPRDPDRPRALDSYVRGKRVVHQGPRPGDIRDNPVQPIAGSIAAPPSGNLDAAFDDPSAGPGGPKQAGRWHRMQKGQNLWAVARRYGVTVDEIVRANHIQDPQHLPAGTRIFIPGEVVVAQPEPLPAPVDVAPVAGAPGETPSDGRGVYHVVKQGDTMRSLSRLYGVPAPQIKQWNPTEVSQGLPVGCTVFIPGAVAGKRVVPGLPSGAKPEKVASFRAHGEAGFQWPINGTVISKFGMRNGRPHTGLDIAADQGTTIHAAMAGKVIYSGTMNGYGNVVILDHQNGYFTVYGHNERNLVAVDRGAPQLIRAGQVIARVGMTGNASRPHVHFEIRRSNDALDPLTLLQRPASQPFAARPVQARHAE